MMNPSSLSQRRAYGIYPPWEYLLRIDEVNYNLKEQLAVSHQLSRELVNLASGVSYYAAPDILLEETKRAISYPIFHRDYDSPFGSPIAVRAIQACEEFTSEHPLELSDEHVMLTPGASMALHLLSLYFAERYPGCEVLVPIPTFPMAAASMAFAGLRVKEVTHVEEGRTLPTLNEYEKARSKDTKLLLLNIYNNPTGETYGSKELARIMYWAKDNQIIVIVDKISIDMELERSAPNILDIAYEQDGLQNVIVISSLSKDRSLPGLRIGWIIGEPQVIAQLARYNALISISVATPLAAPLFTDMLCRTVRHLLDRQRDLPPDLIAIATRFIDRVQAFAPLFPDLDGFFVPYQDSESLKSLFARYSAWHRGLLDLLRQNWKLITHTFEDHLVASSICHGGFNTFVHLPLPDSIDHYQFTVDLFRQRGILILPGPVFGGQIADWQTHPGFWTRLSFAMKEEKFKQGLEELVAFASAYGG